MTYNFALETLGASGCFLILHIAGRSLNLEKWQDMEHILVSSVCTAFNVYCFMNGFEHKQILSQLPPSALLQCQAAVMLGYYVVYGLIESMNPRSGMMALHHVLAAVTIWYAHAANVHQCICAFLMLFTVSNPYLALAKTQYRASGGKHGCISFCIFALLFFVFRICLVPCLIWVTLTDGWYFAITTGQLTTYVLMNTLLVGLYLMQLIWFHSIVRICSQKIIM
jgi:hypothetical protein